MISGTRGFKFRTLNDPEGDCATLCTVIFDTREQAVKVSKALGSKTVDQSGWHVYANMEHVLNHLKKVGQPHTKGSYPKTDDILSRSMNISIGVVDGGLGAGWGININSTDAEIEAAAKQFNDACKYFSGPKGRKWPLSLTFDDARLSQPDKGIPVLDKYGVKATFYLVPSTMEKRLDGWKKAVKSGHEIGNHSLTHPCTGNFDWSRDNALEDYTLSRMSMQLDSANKIIKKN